MANTPTPAMTPLELQALYFAALPAVESGTIPGSGGLDTLNLDDCAGFIDRHLLSALRKIEAAGIGQTPAEGEPEGAEDYDDGDDQAGEEWKNAGE